MGGSYVFDKFLKFLSICINPKRRYKQLKFYQLQNPMNLTDIKKTVKF